MEHTKLEAQALHSSNRELQELLLLICGKNGRAVGASLVEVGLYGGPVVRDGPKDWHAIVKDKIAVDLWAVQVLQASGSSGA